jgi:hypothetical protein
MCVVGWICLACKARRRGKWKSENIPKSFVLTRTVFWVTEITSELKVMATTVVGYGSIRVELSKLEGPWGRQESRKQQKLGRWETGKLICGLLPKLLRSFRSRDSNSGRNTTEKFDFISFFNFPIATLFDRGREDSAGGGRQEVFLE